MLVIPKAAIEKGNQAVIGMGRNICTMGSIMAAVKRLQPISSPNGVATTTAKTKPTATRLAEYSTLASHVPW